MQKKEKLEINDKFKTKFWIRNNADQNTNNVFKVQDPITQEKIN
jgi:hypothetical protein